MNLTPEQTQELAKFPPALRTLVESELAAGNCILEIGHSFPAPPAGAYVKLARTVSGRPHVSDGNLVFLSRNNSLCSGEFSDAGRFYFVLEPPSPPPAEPDMDAIRQAAQAQTHPAKPPKPRGTESPGVLSKARRSRSKPVQQPSRESASIRRPIRQDLAPTRAAWLLHFCDGRPPEQIQHRLERDLMALTQATLEAGKLVYAVRIPLTGVQYELRLAYEAALASTNAYSLRLEASWSDLPAALHRGAVATAAGWFDFWTRDYRCSDAVQPEAGSAVLYAQRCEAAQNAESTLVSVPAIQAAIVAALQDGASFATAHKEGGTNICWQHGRFVRSDYGESDARQEFTEEAEFLAFLRRFYDWETSKHCYPHQPSDWVAWKLILRALRT